MDACLAEITPLDRFRPGQVPVFLEGRLVDLRADEQTEVTLRQTGEHDLELRVVNLAAQARTAEVRLPEGFRPSDDRRTHEASATVSLSLSPYGVSHLVLVRYRGENVT